jgi:hypothetical protein
MRDARTGKVAALRAVFFPLLAGVILHSLLADIAVAEEHQTDARTPVVVELFTSQGCNSCPPADALVGELSARADVIALSLHVDYWDYIGWRDPFASPAMTQRQKQYAGELGLRYLFTPQIVINGRVSVPGGQRDNVLAAIEKSRQAYTTPRIDFRRDDGGWIVISAGHAPDAGATVWLAIFDQRHETSVTRGENAGRMIRNYNVVRSLERVGTWMGKRVEIPLGLEDAMLSERDGCAVIVQQGRHGPVLAAFEIAFSAEAQ